MKLRKALATMMAVALAVSPMTVSAADLTAPGSTNIDVEGGATYVDTTVYKVTLPTSNSLKFTLDPSGIFGYVQANDSATSADTSDLTNRAGKIVGIGGHNIVNKSSVEVAVTCDYKLSTTATDVTFSTDTTLDKDTISGNQICLKVLGGTATVSGNDVDFHAGSYEKAIAANTVSGNDVTVLLGAADYEYTISDGNFGYAPKASGTTETSAAVSIGGCISKDHDWSELASGGKKVKLSCVYSFKGVEDSTGVTKDTEGFVTANADKIKYLGGASASGFTATYKLGGTDGLPVAMNGFNVKTATVTSKPGDTNVNSVLTAGEHYKFENGTFTLRGPWISTRPVGTWVITLSDGSTTKTLTVTVTN